MADVFELELHDLHEEDPNRAADSDDDIIEIDEVCILECKYSYMYDKLRRIRRHKSSKKLQNNI